MRHRYLARHNPKARNLRQVHLISSELLGALWTCGFEVRPRDLGENITSLASILNASLSHRALPWPLDNPWANRHAHARPHRVASGPDRRVSYEAARPGPAWAGVMAIIRPLWAGGAGLHHHIDAGNSVGALQRSERHLDYPCP